MAVDSLQVEESAFSKRFAGGEDSDWATLIDTQASISAACTLEQVQNYFRHNEEMKFAAVLDGGNILGLCSERRISRILSMRGGLGFAVYSKNSVLRHLRSDYLIIVRGTPVRQVLDRVMTRQDNFFDDVILTETDGKYLGLIGARTLTLLQHRISHIQTDRLNQNNAELAVARDAANRAAESKSAFLANMSHEIRTPLNGILGMIKILMRTHLTPDQSRFANTVLNSANALLTILNDILDFSKIEAGKMNFESIDFDLADVVEEIVQLLSERAHEKKLDFFSWIDPDVCTRIKADPNRIRQVILNLSANAIKFTEKGEVIIRVENVSETASRTRLRISVIDTGIGIAKEAQTRLFGAFEQADSTTSRRYGGTGLGLAISKKIVQLLDGKIGLDSEHGRGSTFWFEVDLPKQNIPSNSTHEQEAGFHGLRLLLVNDSVSFGSYLDKHLSRWNIRCYQARSAAEAREILQARSEEGVPFEFVVLDSRLPDGNGLELAAEWNRLPAGRKPNIALLTSFEDELVEEHWRSAGVSGVVSRPVKPRELRNCIQRNLHEQPLPHMTERPARPEPLVVEPPRNIIEQHVEMPSLNILLVEDSEVNREVALYLLESWGHKVETAENGRLAVEKLSDRRYDCILMDCQMPEMDGYEATRIIRQPDSPVQDHHVFIIAMTANAMPGDRERCLQSGMNDYVGKPFEESDLVRSLRRCHDENTRRTQPPDDPIIPPPVPTLVKTPSPVLIPPAVPQAAAAQNANDDEPYFPARLVNLFLTETENRLNELSNALASSDKVLVHRITHTIKGSAGNFRARTLYETAAEMEGRARDGNLSGVWELLPQARQDFCEAALKLTQNGGH